MKNYMVRVGTRAALEKDMTLFYDGILGINTPSDPRKWTPSQQAVPILSAFCLPTELSREMALSVYNRTFGWINDYQGQDLFASQVATMEALAVSIRDTPKKDLKDRMFNLG